MITVRLWLPDPRQFAIGHASVHLTGNAAIGDLYMSVWPDNSRGVWTIRGAANALADDLAEEGGEPMTRVQFNHLNEAAIADYWNDLRRTGRLVWSMTLGWNCMNNAAAVLMKGTGDDPRSFVNSQILMRINSHPALGMYLGKLKLFGY